MECASCETMLDELRRGGLPARTEAEARSHLAHCPRCRAAHMRRLRVDAETSGPLRPSTRSPSRAREAIVRVLFPAPKPRVASTLTHDGAVRGVLGRLAMAPQVAMGMVMLLIVLVGLWSVPQLTRRHVMRFRSSFGSERVNPPKPETDTSTALAEPAPLKIETRDEHATPETLPPSAAKSPGQRANGNAHAGLKVATNSDLDSAMQHYHAHEYAQATPLFSHALLNNNSPADEASALLYLARTERALGHCDRAVNSYDTLVRVHPGRPEAKDALHEAVSCYERLSQPGKVWRLLEQASQTRDLSAEARSISSQRSAGPRKANANLTRTD
ncbi:MAG TPA: zf-HC2 domain-containing protein [Polyangiales bacterium]